MGSMVKKQLALGASAFGFLLLATPAAAQDGDGQDAERSSSSGTIMVTAQRREQELQDVPIAVTSLSPQDVENRQITETLDVVTFVPNAVAQNNTGPGAANSYYIRGLGSSQSLATFDPPVGSYVDDLFIARQAANNFAFFDLERIEVLRGPQGTLFGRNTTGGAVRIILKKPSRDFGGFVEAGYGSFDRVSLRGSVDLPLSENLLTKVSAYYIDDDGFVRNVETGEDGLNDENNFGVRGAIRAFLGDSITWDVAADYIENDHANEINFEVGGERVTFTGITRDGSTLVRPGTDDRLISGRKGAGGPGSKVKSFSATSNLSIELGDSANLELITGYLDTEQSLLTDVFSGGIGVPGSDFPALQTALPAVVRGSARRPTGGFLFGQLGQHEQFTQEIKLDGELGGRVNYVAGIYYFHEANETGIGQVFTLGSGFPLLLADNDFTNDTEAWAVYAQADVDVTDRLTATIGGRYTDETKDIAFTDNVPTGAPSDHTTAAFLAAGLPDELETSLFTPRFALSYDITDDVMLFASATRGFKSGGWNASATDIRQALPFDAEKVWSYEGGLRTAFMGGLGTFNVTGFYSDVSDYQVLSALQLDDGSFAFVTRNFADLEVIGLEVEASISPFDGVTFFGSLGLQDADYVIDPNAPEFDEFGVRSIAAQQAACLDGDDDSCGSGIVTTDGSIAEPTRTPELSGVLGVSIRQPMGSLGADLLVNGNVRYFSDHPRGTDNAAFGFTGDQALVNASVGLDFDNGLSLNAGCRNCLDEVYLNSTVGPLGWINDPAQWFVDVRFDF